MTDPFNKYVVQLKADDFDEIESWKLLKHKCSFVMFYIDGCGWCDKTKPVWNDLARKITFYDIAVYNCRSYPEHYQRLTKDVPELVKGYPTLVVYSGGEPIHVYEGERTLENLVNVCMKACKDT